MMMMMKDLSAIQPGDAVLRVVVKPSGRVGKARLLGQGAPFPPPVAVLGGATRDEAEVARLVLPSEATWSVTGADMLVLWWDGGPVPAGIDWARRVLGLDTFTSYTWQDVVDTTRLLVEAGLARGAEAEVSEPAVALDVTRNEHERQWREGATAALAAAGLALDRINSKLASGRGEDIDEPYRALARALAVEYKSAIAEVEPGVLYQACKS